MTRQFCDLCGDECPPKPYIRYKTTRILHGFSALPLDRQLLNCEIGIEIQCFNSDDHGGFHVDICPTCLRKAFETILPK